MTTRTKPRFELVATKDGKQCYSLKGAHGEILMAGMSRGSLSEVIHDINQVLVYGGLQGHFNTIHTASGNFWFGLMTPKGEKIGFSGIFHSEQGRDNAIVAVRRAVQSYTPTHLN